MRINLFPCVERFNKEKQARARRIRQAEIDSRRRLPMWKRWFRRVG